MTHTPRLAIVLAWVCGMASLVATTATAAPPSPRHPPRSDAYIEGYAAALLQEKFGVSAPSLAVRDGVVTVEASDLKGADRPQVIATLRRIRGVADVEVSGGEPPGVPGGPAPPARAPGTRLWDVGGLPGGLLFRPLIADPRWPHFSASYQYYIDDPDFGAVAAVSFGETFTLYRDRIGRGLWEVGIQAGVFSVFDLDSQSFDLINADYFVAAVLGYRHGDLSALGRLFHQSSHLGDEFLLRRSSVDRVNLSYEGIDAKVSYDLFGDVLRPYVGAGFIFDQEPSGLDPWSFQYGLEFRSPWPGPGKGYRPIAAADIQHREENDWSADLSLRAGVQLEGLVLGRDLELLLEYFNGRSPNGQFYRRKVDYIGIGAHFHF
jgi:hypothetical protein